jgi:hypothetical protein
VRNNKPTPLPLQVCEAAIAFVKLNDTRLSQNCRHIHGWGAGFTAAVFHFRAFSRRNGAFSAEWFVWVAKWLEKAGEYFSRKLRARFDGIATTQINYRFYSVCRHRGTRM